MAGPDITVAGGVGVVVEEDGRVAQNGVASWSAHEVHPLNAEAR